MLEEYASKDPVILGFQKFSPYIYKIASTK